MHLTDSIYICVCVCVFGTETCRGTGQRVGNVGLTMLSPNQNHQNTTRQFRVPIFDALPVTSLRTYVEQLDYRLTSSQDWYDLGHGWRGQEDQDSSPSWAKTTVGDVHCKETT